MALGQRERILILAKTYPSPSANYIETSCVAGINEDGMMRRLFPVPFRLIEEGKQFKKWQWINARVAKASRDHRPESHRVFVDTIQLGEAMDSRHGWGTRGQWLHKIPTYRSIKQLDNDRRTDNISLGILLPTRIQGLEITKVRHPNWTDAERAKLIRDQVQGNLFAEADAKRQVNRLRKIPFNFYYRFSCETDGNLTTHRHKIIDWEAGALYLNCQRRYGDRWEEPFRRKLEDQLMQTNLMFLMGNQQRFQEQWMIISLIYPPMPTLRGGSQYLRF